MCMSNSSPALDDEGMVELLAAGSSPTRATAPPRIDVPAYDRVAERVGGAVDARCLAVPDAHDRRRSGSRAATTASWEPITAVAPYSSFMAWWNTTGRSGSSLAALATALAVAAERGPLVAGDERRGVQAGATVGPQLFEGQPGQRLDPGEEDGSLVGEEPIVELVVLRGSHPNLRERRPSPAAGR